MTSVFALLIVIPKSLQVMFSTFTLSCRDLWLLVSSTALSAYRNSRSSDTVADLVFSLHRLKSGLLTCLWWMLMPKSGNELVNVLGMYEKKRDE